MTSNEAQEWLRRRMGFVVAIALNSCNPYTNTFIQGCTSISLWRQGASLKLHGTFSSLGISQSETTARRLVDKLKGFHNDEIISWKAKCEVMLLS